MVNALWIVYGGLCALRMALVNDFPLGWQEILGWFAASVVLALYATFTQQRERAASQKELAKTKNQRTTLEGAMIGLGISQRRVLEAIAPETIQNPKRQAAIQDLSAKIAQVAALLPPTISILRPSEGERVAWRDNVTGTVEPPGAKFQVVTFARDNKYYAAGVPTTDRDGRWSVSCQFGNDKSPLGSRYEIVVISGVRIGPGPHLSLPQGADVRRRVTVYRK